MSKLVLGVDEAGRGAVVGPLCIAAVVVEENRQEKLERMGVDDSKKLSRQRREELEDEIKDVLEDFAVVKIPAEAIDEEMKRKSLNLIESERMAELIEALRPDKAIVDATEAKTENVKRTIQSLLDEEVREEVEIVSENHADENYPVVSAASILAKVTRDRSVSGLEEKLNQEIGNGYPSDGRTKEFLKKMIEEDGRFSRVVRESWTTAERIIKEKEQGNLSDFCD
ncbi:MAG: ribonuclease HII [Candidatus Aenigmatarchaeota archaeon]